MNKNYVPLYRKYRPQMLEQIVGQEHVKKALTNAITSDRISHAYLFTGPRGTGKTSTARIFAKSLNCIKGPTTSPCNVCENCINITKSVPIDVIEIDAASNRSVSDAEEIIKNVAMAPVHSRYKIYIIDEVHMLTPTAFNALLKTLEEPPENVIFILATTEVHKVLDTIKSRCQRFDFRRITTEDISQHLRFISDSENINITDEALNYIASNSAGGMRDSIALLDQLSVLNSEREAIGVDDINRLLGRISFDEICALFDGIIKSDPNLSLEIVNNFYNQGNEPSQILSNFLEFLRNSLIIKSTESKSVSDIIQLNSEQINKLYSMLNNTETHQIISLIDKCAAYIKELKLTTAQKLWLDVATLDMANMVQNTKLEELQFRLQQLESGNVSKVVSAYNTPPMPVNKMTSDEHKKEEHKLQGYKPQTELKKEQNDSDGNDAPITKSSSKSSNSEIKNLWVKFLDSIPSFASRAILKQHAQPVKLTSEEVIISIKSDSWLTKFRDEADRLSLIETAAKAVVGGNPKIIIRAPEADDNSVIDSISGGESPKTLIPENNYSDSADVDDITTDSDENAEKTLSDKKKINLANNLNDQERAFHSDNVNMIIDLFEGKIIE